MIMNKNLLLYTFVFFLTITSSIIFGGTVSADGQMKIVEKSKEISAEEKCLRSMPSFTNIGKKTKNNV